MPLYAAANATLDSAASDLEVAPDNLVNKKVSKYVVID